MLGGWTYLNTGTGNACDGHKICVAIPASAKRSLRLSMAFIFGAIEATGSMEFKFKFERRFQRDIQPECCSRDSKGLNSLIDWNRKSLSRTQDAN